MRLIRTSRLLAASVVAVGALALSAAEPVPVEALVLAPAKNAGPADEKAVRALLKEKVKLGNVGALARWPCGI